MWGIKLKKLIKKHNMSQREIAAGTETLESSVSVWINQTYPPLDFIEKCCEYMDIPLWQFFAPDDLVIPEMTAQQGEIWKMIQDADQDMKILILDALTTLVRAYNLGKEK